MRIVVTGGNGDIAKAILQVMGAMHTVLTPSKVELDVTDADDVWEYMTLNKPDVLINNAGFILPKNITEASQENLKKHFDVNVIGAATCSKFAIKNGCKLIINIGSTAGSNARAGWFGYCASKAALEMLTQCLIAEGVDSVYVELGRTDTKMRRTLVKEEDKNTLLTPRKVAEGIVDIIDIKGTRISKDICGYKVRLTKKDGLEWQ